MPLFDRVKAGATQAVQKAQDAGKAGQAKLDEIQAKRHLDSLYRDLGAAVYAQHVGGATAETTAAIDRLESEIEAHEAEHGPGSDDANSEADDSTSTSSTSGETPDGGYRLD